MIDPGAFVFLLAAALLWIGHRLGIDASWVMVGLIFVLLVFFLITTTQVPPL